MERMIRKPVRTIMTHSLLFLEDFTSPAAGSMDSLLLLCGDLPEWTLGYNPIL